MTLHTIRPALRTRLVELALNDVTAGRWTAPECAHALRSVGFAASAPRVAAAASLRATDAYESQVAAEWLVERLARPIGGLVRRAAA